MKDKSFALALSVSVAAHAVFLAVNFVFPPTERKQKESQASSMTAVLVNLRTDAKPEKAEHLAQANQDGGGENEDGEAPSNPLPMAIQASFAPEAVAAERPAASKKVKDLERQIEQLVLAAKKSKTLAEAGHPAAEYEPPPPSKEAAELAAKVEKELAAYAKRPKKAFIGAAAQESYLATWVEAWQRKVEQVGNSFYPEAARGKIRGDLVLTAGIKSNGQIESIEIDRSSGHAVLDDSARRILALGAPFDKFGIELKARVDVIYVTRKWRFGYQGLERLEADSGG